MTAQDPVRPACLATVATDSFVPGTMVLLYSFLKHHRGSGNDVVVFHEDLSPDSIEYLSRVCDRIRFVKISPDLQRHIKNIVEARPDLEPIKARFYSLDAFRLRGYKKVLFCDSDIVFLQSIGELFDRSEEFIACGDGPYYQGTFHESFNAGFFMVGEAFLTDEHCANLLSLASADTFRDPRIDKTDQVVLNLYFRDRYCRVGAEYNYLLAYRDAIRVREETNWRRARALHFNGPEKPWIPSRALRGSSRNPEFAAACGTWFENYAECLRKVAFRGLLHSVSCK